MKDFDVGTPSHDFEEYIYKSPHLDLLPRYSLRGGGEEAKAEVVFPAILTGLSCSIYIERPEVIQIHSTEARIRNRNHLAIRFV